jgi:hypothetical protein
VNKKEVIKILMEPGKHYEDDDIIINSTKNSYCNLTKLITRELVIATKKQKIKYIALMIEDGPIEEQKKSINKLIEATEKKLGIKYE